MIFSFATIAVVAQPGKRLLTRIDALKAMLSRADTLSPFDEKIKDVGDTISELNDQIGEKLASILTDPGSLRLNLDSLLEHPALGKVHSADKRLWIFSWAENTGGSWKSALNVVHYRTGSKKLKADIVSGDTDDSEPGFCSKGAGFNKIFKLRSKNRDLYLCMGSGTSCNTCEYEIATVVELTKDSINYSYPAFRPRKVAETEAAANWSCHTLDARRDDIEQFEFNPKTQVLTMVYLTDDYTPVQSAKQKRIRERLLFDGTSFVYIK